MKAVPGQAGHIFATIGNQQTTHPNITQLFKCTDGGATWNAISNVAEPFCVGFGLHAVGQTYPASTS